MEVLTPQKKRKPLMGILAFIAAVLMLIFIAFPLQVKFGIWGVALTEVLVLAFTLLFILLSRAKIREALPFHKPRLAQILGTIVFWFGTLQLVALAAYVMIYLFPQQYQEVSKSLSDVITSGAPSLAIFVAAILPAVCEESLCRGFVQYSLGNIRKKWIVILLVGLMFGLLHLSAFRFLPMAMLGMALAYVMYKTENLFLPMLFHLINNLVSVAVSFSPAASQAASQTLSLVSGSGFSVVGAIFMVYAPAPFILLLGGWLLGYKKNDSYYEETDAEAKRTEHKKNKKYILGALFASILLFAAGLIIVL